MLASPRHDLDPLSTGHAPVDDGDVVVVELEHVDGVVAALGRVDLIAVVLQAHDEDFAQAGIVLSHEHAHRVSLPSVWGGIRRGPAATTRSSYRRGVRGQARRTETGQIRAAESAPEPWTAAPFGTVTVMGPAAARKAGSQPAAPAQSYRPAEPP